MIVSHKYRFIFLKTKKTGGTSLEIALSLFAGDRDILTRLDNEDEQLRGRRGGRPPQRYLRSGHDCRPSVWKRSLHGLWHRLRTGRCDRCYLPFEPFRQHMDAHSVRLKVGEDIWHSYFKFAVERNPWERAISTYYWKTSRWARVPTFREFVINGDAHMLPRNFDVYSIRGIPAIDRIIDYATLKDDLPPLFDELGLPVEAWAAMQSLNAKGHYRPKRDYRDYYDDETRRIISLQCAQEIAFMGYTF